MESGELKRKLHLLKEDFDRKRKKLEKAYKASKKKLLVGYTVQELNTQSTDDEQCKLSESASSHSGHLDSGQAGSTSDVIADSQHPSTYEQHSDAISIKNLIPLSSKDEQVYSTSSNSDITVNKSYVSLSSSDTSVESTKSDSSDMIIESLVSLSTNRRMENVAEQCSNTLQKSEGYDVQVLDKKSMQEKDSAIQDDDDDDVIIVEVVESERPVASQRLDPVKGNKSKTPVAGQDISDSSAITPTLKSLGGSCAGFPESPDLLTLLECGFSYHHTSSLNLNVKANLHENKPDGNLVEDSLTKNATNHAATTSNIDAEHLGPVKTRVIQKESERQTSGTTSNIKVETADSEKADIDIVSASVAMIESKGEAKPDIEIISVSSSSSETFCAIPDTEIISGQSESETELVRPLLPVSMNKQQGALLRHQGISSEKGAALSRNDQLMSSHTKKTFIDHFGYTDGSQSKKRKKGTSSVQRKSPRLSPFEFENSDSSSENQQAFHLGDQQNALHRMATKQKKSKQDPYLLSLIEYLLDDMKRDTSFVGEFNLPVDHTDSVSWKGKNCEEQPGGTSSQCASNEQCSTKSLDMEVIPKTEVIPKMKIIPDFLSRRISDDQFGNDIEHSQDMNGQCAPNTVASVKSERSVTGMAQRVQDRDETSHQNQDRTETSLVKAGASVAVVADYIQCKSDCLVGTGTSAAEMTGYDQHGNETCSDSQNFDRGTENKMQVKLTVEHAKRVHAENDSQNFNTGTENEMQVKSANFDRGMKKETENKTLLRSSDSPEHARETVRANTKDLDVKTDNAGFKIRHANLEAASADRTRDNPAKQKSLEVDTRNIASPVACDTQSPSGQKSGDQNFQREDREPHSTHSNGKGGVKPMESADQNGSVRFCGCAESGYADAVLDMVVGTVVLRGEEKPFIFSVQTTALTLWTQEDNRYWSTECQWFMQQNCKAEGACKIYTADKHLVVLVWGFDTAQSVASRLILRVFVYNWDTHDIQRFSLPPPSSVCPDKVFCGGLKYQEDTVIVFTTDKAFTVGKKYGVDTHRSCVSTEFTLQATKSQIIDLHVLQGQTNAIIGLTDHHQILMWDHMTGSVSPVYLPCQLGTISRMYTCLYTQGFLMFHMSLGGDGKDVHLAVLNPETGMGRIITTYSADKTQQTKCLKAYSYHNLVLAVSESGTAHLWKPGRKIPLYFTNALSNVKAAAMFGVKDQIIVVTGQENGCLHLFSALSM